MRPLLVSVLYCLLIASSVSAQSFSDEVWNDNLDTYHAILEHPFLREMQDGTLGREVFAAYLIQDAHYLNTFARALHVMADKAPRAEWARRLRADADASLAEERRLHDRLLKAYGVDADAVAAMEPSADAFAYANYLVATAHDRPFGEAVAALMPCYWIYWEVGKALVGRGSPDPVYRAWITAYASPGYGDSVMSYLDIANAVAAAASVTEREAMKSHFRRASRYEWMFWDSAYHRRGWPLEIEE